MTDKTGLRFTAKTGALPEDRFAVADFTLDKALNLACIRTDINFAIVLKKASWLFKNLLKWRITAPPARHYQR